MFNLYSDLKKENKELKERLEEFERVKRFHGNILKRFESLDPSPLDSEARKEYTAKVAGFFHDILRNKLECMVAEQKDELSLIGQPEWKQNILRANINICNLLLDWGDLMQSEWIATSQDGKKDSEAEKIIKSII